MKSDYTPHSSLLPSSSNTASPSSSTSPPVLNTGHDRPSRLKPSSATSPPPRKSPPPPKLNLDDCKPFIPTNPTSSTPNSGTAFVFTSSRTLRSLQSQPQPVPSNFSSPSASPSTPPLSPTSPSTLSHRSRPSLSTAQLAKHSQGALDARCIVGPNMRAAGFVPLAHTLTPMSHSRHQSASSILSIGDTLPQTPGSSAGIPTPSEPPPFPPMVFVNPSVVATTPMWEYQRAMGWGGPGRQSMSLSVSQSMSQSEINASVTLGPPFVPGPVAAIRTNAPLPHSSSSNTVATLSSTASGSSSSSSNPGSWSSVPSLRSHALKAKAREGAGGISEFRFSTPSVDGYPFPHTPPRSVSESPPSQTESARSSGYSSSSERESSMTASPISSTESTSSNCTIPTPNTSFSVSTMTPPTFASHRRAATAPLPQSRPKPTPIQPSTSSKYIPGVDTPTFATARKRSSRAPWAHELSLTELCDNSQRAFAADPDCLGPLTTPQSSRPSGSSSGSSSSGRIYQGRSRTVSASTNDTGTERRGRERDRNEERARPKHRVPPIIAEVPNAPVQDGARAGVVIGESEVQARGAVKPESPEGENLKDKSKAKDRERQSSSSSRHSHGHNHKGYTSFSFPPPTSSVESKAAPHVLWDREKSHSGGKDVKSNSRERRELRDKEHHRDKGLGALVQAHLDRDREQARQSERERRDALGHAKEKEIAINSDVNAEADVDVVHELYNDWDRLNKKRVSRGRGTLYKPRGDRSHFDGSDVASEAETAVDI